MKKTDQNSIEISRPAAIPVMMGGGVWGREEGRAGRGGRREKRVGEQNA